MLFDGHLESTRLHSRGGLLRQSDFQLSGKRQGLPAPKNPPKDINAKHTHRLTLSDEVVSLWVPAPGHSNSAFMAERAPITHALVTRRRSFERRDIKLERRHIFLFGKRVRERAQRSTEN